MRAERELDAAAITDPALRAGYRACRRSNAMHGRTFYLATTLLPPAKRPYVHALYGFARHCDDIVDDLDPRVDARQRAARFGEWSDGFLGDLQSRSTHDPVSLAVIDTIDTWQIPLTYFEDFLRSMRLDLTVSGYADFSQLAEYMWGSAAVIGLQMLPILGRYDGTVAWPELEAPAADLGIAFQLTNFIRDVGEDLRRGRVYLPQESLDAFGVDRDQLGRGATERRTRQLLAYEVARARTLYRSAERGVRLVHPTSRDCLRTAMTLYEGILDVVEGRDYDVFTDRACVGLRRRATVGLRGLRSARAARRVDLATPTSPAWSSPARTRTADPRPVHRRPANQ